MRLILWCKRVSYKESLTKSHKITKVDRTWWPRQCHYYDIGDNVWIRADDVILCNKLTMGATVRIFMQIADGAVLKQVESLE